MRITSKLFCSTAITTAVAAFLPAAAFAADLPMIPPVIPMDATLPAVSAHNGKLIAFGGSLDGDGMAGIAGAVSMPLGHSFGAQFDGIVGTANSDLFYGGAAHLFWRDPSKGLLGLYASYVTWDSNTTTPVGEALFDTAGADVGKIGVEAEHYMGNVSLEGLLAYQFGDFDGVAGRATAAYYLHDNFRIDATFRHSQGSGSSASAGFEWQPEGWHTSLFAEGGSGLDDDRWFANGGLTIYFAQEQKSLIRRHREDDPVVDLAPDVFEADDGTLYCADGSQPVLDDGLMRCFGGGA